MAETKSEWTEELKAEVVQEYLNQDPTPENTMDIVAEIAENYDKTVNGVRMVLTRAGAYVKKAASASSPKSGGGSKRVNKAEAIDALKDAITSVGQEVDEDIVSRLTGKAAVYFTSVIKAVSG